MFGRNKGESRQTKGMVVTAKFLILKTGVLSTNNVPYGKEQIQELNTDGCGPNPVSECVAIVFNALILLKCLRITWPIVV